MIEDLEPDCVSRTALLLMRQERDVVAGLRRHREHQVQIVAGDRIARSRAGQAALSTAVMTAARAFGDVTLIAGDPEQVLLGGPRQGWTLRAMALAEGVRVSDAPDRAETLPTLVLGEFGPLEELPGRWLLAEWSEWAARVTPVTLHEPHYEVDPGNVLAGIAAGALGVAELFLRALHEPGSHAGLRPTGIDLWSPCEPAAIEPPILKYAPAQWWLLGLGHLGQGFAHAISWLPYQEPHRVQVVLQDIQTAVPANHSTGLFIPRAVGAERKTRIVATALDSCGYDTVILDRRFDVRTPVRDDDVHVALIGLDNLETRHLVESAGWAAALDVGLGAGVGDFEGMTMIRFPGRSTADIAAWREMASTSGATEHDAMRGLDMDACGIARLNGVAVGASFVGALAGVLAVTEALRGLHGGALHSVLSASLREGTINGATADSLPPVALPLA